MIPSKALMSTLCRRLGIGTITEGRNPLRDIYLASIMRDAEDFTLVYRKSPQGGHAKAFACFSTKYQHTPQKIVFDFMRLLSNMKTLEGGHLSVRQYRINHFITSIDFSLNELSDTIRNFLQKLSLEQHLVIHMLQNIENCISLLLKMNRLLGLMLFSRF